MSGEFDFEPLPGLPQELPAGERILWQGAPHWPLLLQRAFHLRALLGYFALLLGWRLFDLIGAAEGTGRAMRGLLIPMLLAATAVGLLALFSWLIARSTVYTITTRRVVMRFGVALPMALNLPFSGIAAASLRQGPQGSGDLALSLLPGAHVAWLTLWPHARPWRMARPEPMLRGLAQAAAVAPILARALAAASEGSASPIASPQARPAAGGGRFSGAVA